MIIRRSSVISLFVAVAADGRITLFFGFLVWERSEVPADSEAIIGLDYTPAGGKCRPRRG